MEFVADGNTLFLKGFLNERTDLAPLDALLSSLDPSLARVYLDLSGVDKANSCGVRSLLVVLSHYKGALGYRKAPIWLVEQFSIVSEFFSRDMDIDSIEARFYCPEDDTSATLYLKIGVEIPICKNYSELEIVLESSDGKKLEADFDANIYLEFIAKNYEMFNRIHGK